MSGKGWVRTKPKCKRKGCYDPADCQHGYCSRHCPEAHDLRAYGARTFPKTKEAHIGVELECEFPSERDLGRALPLKGHKDGSLATGVSAEFKILATADKIALKVGNLAEELWVRRGRATNRCGLHVHLDMRQVQGTRRVFQFQSWCRDTEKVWFALMPQSRQRNTYVKSLRETEWTDHYAWANATEYNTVEIRLHGGTLNRYKLEGWLSAMVHLQKKAHDLSYVFPTVTAPEGTTEHKQQAEAAFWAVFADCPQEGKEYLESRKVSGGVLRDYAFAPHEEVQ